jgi:hypothetical protein
MISRQNGQPLKHITNANRSIIRGAKPVLKNQTLALPSQVHSGSIPLPRHDSIVSLKRPTFVSSASNDQYAGNVDDIDAGDANDPLCITKYVQDIYEYFRNEEEQTSVRPMFMLRQPHINERMRAVLIDWLVQVHLNLKFVPPTLYLSVKLIDQ